MLGRVFFWCALIAALLLSLSACRHRSQAFEIVVPESDARATITGTVRDIAGPTPVEGRTVEAVSLENGARLRTTTGISGGFRFQLAPGKYRIELDVHRGETIVSHPDVIDLNRPDVGARADFVLSAPRLLRPRSFAPRGDDGLGSAVG